MEIGYSKLLVHELVVSEKGTSRWSATQDFKMMAKCGSLERTEKQRRDLREKVDFEFVDIFGEAGGGGSVEKVIEVVLERED